MKLRTSLALVVSFGATAHAQSAMDLVARSGGNLRVSVNCADTWATPDSGLQLTVDGVAVPSLGTNGVDAVGYTRHGNPFVQYVTTDVGYAVTPGTHHIQLDAPGCASGGQDVEVWPFIPRMISGRLETTDSSLLGPVGAPDGLGLMVGAYGVGHPAHPGSYNVFSATYAYDPGTTEGGLLSLSYEHRNFVAAFDVRLGTQSTSGTAMYNGSINESRGPFAFTGSEVSLGGVVRVGARLPLRDVALEAGTGIGGDAVIPTGGSVNTTTVPAPNDADGDWFVPLWASATIKPTCNWGAQVLASYELHPTASSESAVSVAAGLIWQPSASCSEAPGLSVR